MDDDVDVQGKTRRLELRVSPQEKARLELAASRNGYATGRRSAISRYLREAGLEAAEADGAGRGRRGLSRG